MKVRLAYGREGLWVDFPDQNVTVVESSCVPGLPNEEGEIREALYTPLGMRPLRDLVKTNDTGAIVFSDTARPQRRARMLPILLEEISPVPVSRSC